MTEATQISAPPQTSGNRFARAHHILIYFSLAVLVIWLVSGLYQVQEGQVAIVERLGQYLATPAGKAIQLGHGLHYHLPWPIDRVHVISTQQRMTLNVKTFNTSPAEYDDFKRQYMSDPNNPFASSPQAINAIFNPYLVAGDKSVIQMEISVIFRVNDPELWLQSISHEYSSIYDATTASDLRNAMLQEMAQRAMVAEASRLSFEDLLLEKRDRLPLDLQTLVSKGLVIETTDGTDPKKPEEIGLGIDVIGVQVTSVHAPEAIQRFYDRVLQNRVGRDTAITNASRDADVSVRQAIGEKETLRVDAEAYRNSALQKATGESQRFAQVLAQYLAAPEVMRNTLYVDALTSVTSNAKRIIFARPGEKVFYTVDPPEYDPNQVKPKPGN